MEVLVELLPPSYTGKAEPTAKDSRRQQQEQQAGEQKKGSELDSEIKTIANAPAGKERRKGEDRRRQRMIRGRWLESRNRNDRRASALKIFVKV